MTRVTKSAIVNATAEKVWTVIKDFEKMASWHPVVAQSSTDINQDNAIGTVRTCNLEGGGVVKEVLLEHDDHKRTFSYQFLESPMPMSNAATRVEVKSVTEGDQTYIEWSMGFEPDEGAENDLIEMVSGMITAGFESLQQRLNR